MLYFGESNEKEMLVKKLSIKILQVVTSRLLLTVAATSNLLPETRTVNKVPLSSTECTEAVQLVPKLPDN